MGLNFAQIEAELGYRKAYKLPRGMIEGPFRFRGLFDFDANADSEADLTAAAATADVDETELTDPRLQFLTRVTSRPELIMHVEGVSIQLLDDAAAQTTDPEKFVTVANGTTLRIKQGESEDRWPLRDALSFPYQLRTLVDSDLATTTREYSWLNPGFYELPQAVDVDMETCTKFAIGFTAAALNTVLAANSNFDAFIHGYAIVKGSPAHKMWLAAGGGNDVAQCADGGKADEQVQKLELQGEMRRLLGGRSFRPLASRFALKGSLIGGK